jgi:hypothetical protein
VIVGEFGLYASPEGDACERSFAERADQVAAKVQAYTTIEGYAGAFAWAWQPGGDDPCEYGNLDADGAARTCCAPTYPDPPWSCCHGCGAACSGAPPGTWSTRSSSAWTKSVLTFLVAGSVDDVTFGGFAEAFTVFAVLIGVSRAVAASPLAVRYQRRRRRGVPHRVRVGARRVARPRDRGRLVLLGVGALLGDVGGQGVSRGPRAARPARAGHLAAVFFAAGRPAPPR